MKKSISKILYELNPYFGFIKENYTYEAHGWGSDAKVFSDLIREIKPSLIIEVGSWKGASAITMAQKIKELNLECEILCIDTWSGAPEFWLDQNDKDRFLSLKLKNGYPTVYYQFLANICFAGASEIVTPLPLPSNIAASVLKTKEIKADLIYIDGSHEYPDVFVDILTWIPFLNSGGIIFGDDYDEFWPSVVAAVKDATKYLGLEYEVIDSRNWVIRNSNITNMNILNNFIKNRKEKELENTPILKIALDRIIKRFKK